MYNVGDKVIIHRGDIYVYDEECPLANLDGTLAEIVSVKHGMFTNSYDLHFIEIVAKRPEKYEEYQQHMAWEDEHLIPYEENEIELNTLELFI